MKFDSGAAVAVDLIGWFSHLNEVNTTFSQTNSFITHSFDIEYIILHYTTQARTRTHTHSLEIVML